MSNPPRETLGKLIARHGVSLCDDPRRVEAFLSDLCGEEKQEISVLVAALEEKVAEQLLASQDGVPRQVVLGRLTERLVKNRAIVEVAARQAVETWALVLGVVSPRDLTTGKHVRPRPSTPKPGAPSGFQLKPYTLCAGQIATTPRDLARICDADWHRALDHFMKGYMVAWLRDKIPELRNNHQHGPADFLEQHAAEGEQILKSVRGRNAHERSIGLERFLRGLGAPAPILDVSRAAVAFPAVGVGEAGQSVSITMSNQGRGYLHGHIRSTESWLRAMPQEFGCAARNTVTVQLQPDLRRFSPGQFQLSDVIDVRSNGGDIALSVEVEILPPELGVGISILDFGSVVLGETCQVTFKVWNTGPGRLTGTVDSQLDWLLASPTSFHVPSGGSTQIAVTAHPRALPAGEISEVKAVLVNSNGGQHWLAAALDIRAPCLNVETEHICVPIGRDGKGTATLRVTNTGAGVLEFQASITALDGSQPNAAARQLPRHSAQFSAYVWPDPARPWDSKSPAAPQVHRCPAGQSVLLHVAAYVPELSSTSPLPEGKLILKSNGGDTEIRVTTERGGPWLYAGVQEIDLGCYSNDPPPTGLLPLQNLGNEALRCRLEAEDSWLKPAVSELQIPPRDCVSVELRPISEHPVKLRLRHVNRRTLASKIHVTSNGGQADIPVRLISEYHG
jgi:hypothetical protein